MATEVKVPSLGESITEATVLEWLVEKGTYVTLDQELVVLETDKVTVPVPSPVAGVLVDMAVGVDDVVEIGALLATVDETAEATSTPEEPAAPEASSAEAAVMPSARRLATETGIDTSTVEGTGRGGRVLKEDVQRASKPSPKTEATPPSSPVVSPPAQSVSGERHEEVVPMSRLRRRIAERLVEAQNTAAMLTTFNEIDMSAVMALRSAHKESFHKKHGVKLGFTSFFAKAVIEGLKAFPAVNAEIRGTDIVYKNYYDIGVAVGGGRGLVVPVIRSADRLSFAEIEQTLGDLAVRARDNKLTLPELEGGTFTISNGGVYGSLLSTPILNPPQSGILGLHKIERRPIAVGDQVVVRPMMYVALSYDHRIIDGREAVSFLVKVKECIEEPSRILLEV